MCVWGCRLVREMVLWAVAVLLVTLGPGAWGRPAVIQRYCDQCECILRYVLTYLCIPNSNDRYNVGSDCVYNCPPPYSRDTHVASL